MKRGEVTLVVLTPSGALAIFLLRPLPLTEYYSRKRRFRCRNLGISRLKCGGNIMKEEIEREAGGSGSRYSFDIKQGILRIKWKGTSV